MPKLLMGQRNAKKHTETKFGGKNSGLLEACFFFPLHEGSRQTTSTDSPREEAGDVNAGSATEKCKQASKSSTQQQQVAPSIMQLHQYGTGGQMYRSWSAEIQRRSEIRAYTRYFRVLVSFRMHSSRLLSHIDRRKENNNRASRLNRASKIWRVRVGPLRFLKRRGVTTR